MTMIDPERVSYEEAEKRGVGELLDDASRHPIAVRIGGTEVFVLSADVVGEVIEALEVRDDVSDAILVLSRMLTDTGERYSLSDVIAELGLTQEEIDAAPD